MKRGPGWPRVQKTREGREGWGGSKEEAVRRKEGEVVRGRKWQRRGV